jgi:hypothetical protein
MDSGSTSTSGLAAGAADAIPNALLYVRPHNAARLGYESSPLMKVKQTRQGKT